MSEKVQPWIDITHYWPGGHCVRFMDINSREYDGNFSKESGEFYAYGISGPIPNVSHWYPRDNKTPIQVTKAHSAPDVPAVTGLIPEEIENWISDWLKENVVSGPEDWVLHNAKVVWARAAAIALYVHLQEDGIPAEARPILDKIESIALKFAEPAEKVKVPLEENLEAIIGELWEEDNRTIGGQGINPHAYRIGCRAMYKLTANEHPAVMYWFHKFMTAAGAQGGVTKTASNETTPQK